MAFDWFPGGHPGTALIALAAAGNNRSVSARTTGTATAKARQVGCNTPTKIILVGLPKAIAKLAPPLNLGHVFFLSIDSIIDHSLFIIHCRHPPAATPLPPPTRPFSKSRIQEN